MSMRCPDRAQGATLALALAVLLAAACSREAVRPSARVLRVCADPNNLPFSNADGEGFENRIAALIARDLDADLEVEWWAQRRGFVRNTLNAKRCDMIVGVPASFELVQPTRPYYRSTYVFVTRRDDQPPPGSFDDPVLRTARIGVQLVGDDYMNAPPAHALARRGIVENVRGYLVYGDYRDESPPADVLRALVAEEIDVAVVWGPVAGWFAKTSSVPLEIAPVHPQIDLPFLPFVYDISAGVRRGDTELLREIESVLARDREAIDAILAEYGVPRVDLPVVERRAEPMPDAATERS